MCLAVDMSSPVRITLTNGSEKRGYLLCIQKKSRGTSCQEWGFSSSAQVFSLCEPSASQVLTCLHDKLAQSVEIIDNGKVLTTNEVSLVVMDKVSGPLAKYQRWAIKQDKTFDQWKQTKVDNPQWKKMSYSWPVLPDGTWNTEYKWPLEGIFINGPPHPRHSSQMGSNKGKKDQTNQSIPLHVYKNGEKDVKRYVSVVAPELQPANIGKKDRNSKEAIEAQRNIERIEFGIFMERATSLLNLPFAARRLFSDSGKELFSLRGLSRDQIVFVSSGEMWQNPVQNKSDSQKRKLLGKLGADVQRIEEYCLLRDPSDLVLMIWGGFVPGSSIIAAKRVSSDDEQKAPEIVVESNEMKDDAVDEETLFNTGESWHARSHKHSDERAKKLLYSWQQHSGDEEGKKDDSAKSKTQKKKKKRKNFSPRSSTSSIGLLQRFVWKNGFISPYADPSLSVGIKTDNIESMGQKVDVQLVKRSQDDPMQKWVLGDGGMITLECNSQVALSAIFPTTKNDNVEFDEVVAQKRGDREVGYARQRWKWDPKNGNLFAFDASVADKEVTAANHVGICTYVVRGQEVLNQEGYVMEMPGNRSNDPTIVCKSCANVLRGNYHMTRTPSHWTFTCAMGTARKRGLKLSGSFACLNGKIDLSTYEAEPTYNHWMRQLHKLRKQTSVRSISRDIDSAGCIQAWRLYIRQNGTGYNSSGELITGSSVLGVLDQATHRLSLSSAARKLFMSDGSQILHLDHLRECQDKNQEVPKEENEKHKTKDTTESEDNGSRKIDRGNEGMNSTEGTPDHSTAEYSAADLSRGVAIREKYTADNTTTSQSVIELWVSCGENFIPPDVADQMIADNIQAHAQRNNRNLQMDTERHIIRHIHGRRRGQMSPRDLVATRNSKQPVVLSGGWMETTTEETTRQEHVNQIQEKQRKTPQKNIPRLKSAIYKQPTMKRIVAQQRNDVATRTYAWGETLDQLLDDITVKLSLRKNVNALFTESGGRVKQFEDIERDAIYIVRPPRCGSSIKQKAKWAQDRKTPSIEANTWVISTPEKIETGAYTTPQLTAE